MPLTITRRIDQALVIGDSIVVTVKQVHVNERHRQVVLQIEAPAHVSVDRLEIRRDKERHGVRRRPRPRELPEHFCGCCGRELAGDVELWCPDCRAHLAPADGRRFHERTYYAQHGRPCPFQIGGRK